MTLEPTDKDKHAGTDEEFVPADDTVVGKAFNGSLVVIAVIGIVITTAIWMLRKPDAPPPTEIDPIAAPQIVTTQAIPPTVAFTDITQSAGIDFVHQNGATGDKLMPETMGSGLAFFDFDNDGDQDLLFVNATHWPESNATDNPTLALYANDGTGTFTNVTVDSGLNVSLYGCGVAVADYNADGWTDVFISAVGENKLFKNNNGQFTDVTTTANVAGDPDEWGTSAAFFDYNNDGHLDLFVANYIRWTRKIDFAVDFKLLGVGRAYGPPTNFQGTFPYLYKNNGDGTFTDVSRDAGIQITNPATGGPVAKGLGLAPIDIDRDGFLDIFLANDTVRNFLFHNQKNGTFTESADIFGLAYDREGSATGAMGIDAGHYRNNDDLGFFIGNFANEMTSLYVSQGDPTLFADQAIGEGIGATSRSMLTFGLFLFDYDLDGRLDLLQVNGHLEEEINKVQPSQHYEQPAQLFWNSGPENRRCFVPVNPDTTGHLAKPIVGRASAYADIDNDGDLDVVFTQPGRKPLLLRNDQQTSNHWLRIKLVGKSPNRDAIGTQIEITTATGIQIRQVMPTRSYLSQSEKTVTFGLGDAATVESLTITWPDSSSQSIKDAKSDQTMELTQE